MITLAAVAQHHCHHRTPPPPSTSSPLSPSSSRHSAAILYTTTTADATPPPSSFEFGFTNKGCLFCWLKTKGVSAAVGGGGFCLLFAAIKGCLFRGQQPKEGEGFYFFMGWQFAAKKGAFGG
nr:hypothetical protein [Tanacetum cinerariifolium]